MAWICKACGCTFDTPAMSMDGFTHEFGVERYPEYVCPCCDESNFVEADECTCGKLKHTTEILCGDCKAALLRRIGDFFDTLSQEEEEQFDAWMDGCSIQDRMKWSAE